jgi:hypothetical protein
MANIGIDKDKYTALEGSTLLEQRALRRFDVGLRGTAVHDDGGRSVAGKVVGGNVSGSGAYVLTTISPRVGGCLIVDLHGPTESRQLQISFRAVGRILRVEQLPEETFGLAVKFEEITELVQMWGR